MTGQDWIALGLVAAAAAYLVWSFRGWFKASGQAGCPGCGTCGAAKKIESRYEVCDPKGSSKHESTK